VNGPHACLECLRRSLLLDYLAPYIERHVNCGPPSRLPQLLGLGNEKLAAATAPHAAVEILERVAGSSEKHLRARIVRAKCWACCHHDPRFPAGLRDAADSPFALIGRGNPMLLEQLSPDRTVTVVGAKQTSEHSREAAHALGRELAEAGFAVASGLTFGINACAHRGALDRGLTVAILGSGANAFHTDAPRSLWRRITESGLVFSELLPGCRTWHWALLASNRVLAALAGTTIVMETMRASNSHIIAELAVGLGRDLGIAQSSVNPQLSASPHNLLAQGAWVVHDVQDVLAMKHCLPRDLHQA
jgi:DNA processing protein